MGIAEDAMTWSIVRDAVIPIRCDRSQTGHPGPPCTNVTVWPVV